MFLSDIAPESSINYGFGNPARGKMRFGDSLRVSTSRRGDSGLPVGQPAAPTVSASSVPTEGRAIHESSSELACSAEVEHPLIHRSPSLQQRLLKTGGRLVKHAR